MDIFLKYSQRGSVLSAGAEIGYTCCGHGLSAALTYSLCASGLSVAVPSVISIENIYQVVNSKYFLIEDESSTFSSENI